MRGNPHAAFDVAGAGNVAWSKWCDTRRRKGEPTGNTNIDLNRRVSPRPYCNSARLAFRCFHRSLSVVDGFRARGHEPERSDQCLPFSTMPPHCHSDAPRGDGHGTRGP